MYTLYGYPKTRAFRVTWALEELGVDYHYHLVDLKAMAHKTPEYLALSPTGKVPLLGTEEGVLSDSAAILQFLANKHGSPLFDPSMDPFQYGKLMQMLQFLATELEQPLWTIGKHKFALPADKRVRDVLETASWEFEQALAIFASLIENRDYAHGEQFSLVDIYATQTLNWAKGFGLPCDYEHVNAYRARMIGRVGFIRAVEKEKSVLAEAS